MAEFSLGFSEKLVEAGQFVANQDDDTVDAQRTVLYLSCLSCEIALKALLERCGKPSKEIRRVRHDLARLLADVGKYRVKEEITKDCLSCVPATRLRAVTVDDRFQNATVGAILSAEQKGASKYPTKVRYGPMVQHFPAAIVLETARLLVDWARDHWDDIGS